jgi:hypothetical protein
MDQFMGASTILFVSTNLTNRFEQMGVGLYVLKRSEARRHKRRIPLPRNGTKSVDLLELRQLKLQLNGRCLGVKINIGKRLADFVTWEYVACFAMHADLATNMLAIFKRLRDKPKVRRDTLIAVSSHASRGGRHVDFVWLGFEADRSDTARRHVSETLVPNDANGFESDKSFRTNRPTTL